MQKQNAKNSLRFCLDYIVLSPVHSPETDVLWPLRIELCSICIFCTYSPGGMGVEEILGSNFLVSFTTDKSKFGSDHKKFKIGGRACGGGGVPLAPPPPKI